MLTPSFDLSAVLRAYAGQKPEPSPQQPVTEPPGTTQPPVVEPPTQPEQPLKPEREPVPGTPSITPEERPNDPGKEPGPVREHPADPQPATPVGQVA